MRIFLAILAIITLVPLSAFASKGDIYTCDYKIGTRTLISEKIIFGIVHETGSVFVYDDMIHSVLGKPVEAEIVSNDAKKIAIRWSLKIPDRSGTIARVTYRLSFFKGNGTSAVSSQAMGFRNKYNASGKCLMRQGEI